MSRLRLSIVGLLVGGMFVAYHAASASPLPNRLKELRERAEHFERQAEWDKACDIYEAILKSDRNLPEIRRRYHNSLRRSWQSYRHRDPSFRKEVLGLEYGQAMKLYNLIQQTLLRESLDKKKVSARGLFRKGLEELRWALSDPAFLQAHLPATKPLEIQSFQQLLSKTWGGMPIDSPREAQRQVREVALAAHTILGLNATTVILELACGACHALDEHTVYLTPTQFRELCSTLKGEAVGVGLALMLRDNQLIVSDIVTGSAAAEVMPPLLPGDGVVSIDKKPAAQLPVEVAQEMLEGPAGSTVEIIVQSPVMGMRTITLRRRAIVTQSVYCPQPIGTIGYLQITCFHESTLQELDEALLKLTRGGAKALILDLRGNGGGIFDVAIDAARRFLPSGIIASLKTIDARQNAIYESKNPDACTLPLVVLVDGDTASAAEVLAGALKDNKRARIVGQSTFGKGCTQSILKLPNTPNGLPTGGIRVTVARFFSPGGQPYSGNGVLPHILIDRVAMLPGMAADDAQFREAHLQAQRLLER